MRVTTDDPDPVLPPDRRPQPVQRQRVEHRRPRHPGREPCRRRRAAARDRPQRPAHAVRLRGHGPPDFESTLAAHPVPDLPDRRRRRLALRRRDPRLPGGRRRPRHAGLTYTFTSVDLDLDGQMLADAASAAGEVDSSYRDLPTDLPTLVDNLALEVTRDYPSRYEKAVALQDWFREDGGFEYSLDNVPPGNGPDELTAFLTEGPNGRTGYCEQFASAMAVMARVARHPGPGRGGLPGRRAGRHRGPTSSPPTTCTPGRSSTSRAPAGCGSSPRPRPGRGRAGVHHAEPAPAARAGAERRREPVRGPAAQPRPGPAARRGRPARGAVAAGAPGLPLGAGARRGRRGAGRWCCSCCSPAPSGGDRRVRRLTGSPEPAWAELEATARDLGVPWPSGRSPRQTRDRLVDQLGSDPPRRPGRATRAAAPRPHPTASAALDRLVLSLERLRYSRGQDAGDAEAVVADTRTVLSALHGGADERGPATCPLVAGVGAAVAAPAGGGRHRPGRWWSATARSCDHVG